MKVCPETHDNDWIQDAAQIWYERERLEEYLADVIHDKGVCSSPPMMAFDTIVVIGLEEAEAILKERIKELGD